MYTFGALYSIVSQTNYTTLFLICKEFFEKADYYPLKAPTKKHPRPRVGGCLSSNIIPANILDGLAFDRDVVLAAAQHYHGGLAEAVIV